MMNLNEKILARDTRRMARLEKKIKFYELDEKDQSNKINRLKNRINQLDERATKRSSNIQSETLLRINAVKEKLQNETSLTEIEKLQRELSVFEDKETAVNDEHHLISLSHVTMKFGGLRAVDDLSFSVKKGEIFGLIGPNGAGKTTVFNCMTQFYKSTEGNIYYTDKFGDVHNLNDFKVHQIIDLGIARTFQNVELVWELSILDNLLVGAHSLFTASFFDQLFHTPKLKKEERLLREKALTILESLQLLAYKDLIPYGLPYGILKKIELARVLMTNPRLIILDEPAAGLNDQETIELAKTIKAIRQTYDVTIILVEHDMGLVMDICDRICAMSFGQRLAVGTPKEIQSNEHVQTAYLGGE